MPTNGQPAGNAAFTVADPGELKHKTTPADPLVRLAVGRNAGTVRAIHGGFNYAPLKNSGMVDSTVALREKVAALHLPYCYFHDAPGENPGMDLIDVSRLFPIFSADADDPANYRFAENDDYLRQVIEDGTKVIFRFGESIEVGGKVKYRVNPPADFEKWSQICINIVRHYNEGWANGFKWDIRDWAVWEEPNNPNLWSGTFEQYLQLYATLSRRFKARFPHLNIGGPETTTLGIRFLGEFLDFCRAEQLPLDFVGYTAYYRTPAELLAETRSRRAMLDERGFTDIPLWINEWHPSPVWTSFADPVGYRREVARIGGYDGAVFAAAVLCGLQDTPIERACFYSTAMPGGYGIFDGSHRPTPIYYVFEKFCALFDRSKRRIAVETTGADGNFQTIASEHERGIDLLVAVYDDDRRTVKVEIPAGFDVAAAEILDEDHLRFTAIEPHRRKLDGAVLELLKPECAAAFWIELEPSASAAIPGQLKKPETDIY